MPGKILKLKCMFLVSGFLLIATTNDVFCKPYDKGNSREKRSKLGKIISGISKGTKIIGRYQDSGNYSVVYLLVIGVVLFIAMLLCQLCSSEEEENPEQSAPTTDNA
ncbi:uncharacterized protein [Parasteatoda tepidariorum]|uniref:uncharacterized protein isoform X1 n=1 Tax=Parasteatoda tepidariorum TaxID=114398 RepID=UPI00077FD15C|nr:uncharacterized protein LOC107449054 isoform X2 [Parasteatoda tepidariorum]